MTTPDSDYHFQLTRLLSPPKMYGTRSNDPHLEERPSSSYVTLSKKDFYDLKVIVHYNFCRGLGIQSCYDELEEIFGTLIPTKKQFVNGIMTLNAGKK
jgi:hypothetical protein